MAAAALTIRRPSPNNQAAAPVRLYQADVSAYGAGHVRAYATRPRPKVESAARLIAERNRDQLAVFQASVEADQRRVQSTRAWRRKVGKLPGRYRVQHAGDSRHRRARGRNIDRVVPKVATNYACLRSTEVLSKATEAAAQVAVSKGQVSWDKAISTGQVYASMAAKCLRRAACDTRHQQSVFIGSRAVNSATSTIRRKQRPGFPGLFYHDLSTSNPVQYGGYRGISSRCRVRSLQGAPCRRRTTATDLYRMCVNLPVDRRHDHGYLADTGKIYGTLPEPPGLCLARPQHGTGRNELPQHEELGSTTAKCWIASATPITACVVARCKGLSIAAGVAGRLKRWYRWTEQPLKAAAPQVNQPAAKMPSAT